MTYLYLEDMGKEEIHLGLLVHCSRCVQFCEKIYIEQKIDLIMKVDYDHCPYLGSFYLLEDFLDLICCYCADGPRCNSKDIICKISHFSHRVV